MRSIRRLPYPDLPNPVKQSPATIAMAAVLLLLSSAVSLNAETVVDNQPQSPYKACNIADPDAPQHAAPPVFDDANIDNTELSADYSQTDDKGTTTLRGNVIIEQNLFRIIANEAVYNSEEEKLFINGNIHIDTEALSLDASSGTVNMQEDDSHTQFHDIRFIIPNSRMKGSALSISADRSENGARISTLKQTRITSCNLVDPDWVISTDELRLDHDDEYGSADDVVVRFKGVPFLYTPYIEFPTSNRRRSGLLFPEFGTSSSRGLELGLPWYWNIAPNQDAVLTPRYMDKRGYDLGTDYRYLTESTRGEFNWTWLPNDKISDEERYNVHYQQHSDIVDNLSLDIDVQDISDADYFNDFANSLNTTSQTHLDRNARLKYSLNNWQLNTMVQNIKTIDPATPLDQRPYERVPQVTLDGRQPIDDSPVNFTLASEFVDFTHEDSSLTTGNRITVRPGLSLPLSGVAWFFEPAFKYNMTRYLVTTESSAVPEPDAEDVDTPMSSVDAGLFFERFFDNGYQQTLEPRLFYLNVPYRDQNNNPIFDTSIPDFSVSQLFRDNRFIGGDRIGDANQLTVSLTSRIINPATGNEILRASIGQIYYYNDRRVSLDGSVDTSSQSDIIGEFDTSLGNWKTSIDLQWDPIASNMSKENYFIHYMSDPRHLFNIGYRKRSDESTVDIEQTDTSFVYALSRDYSAIARWNYSLKDDKSLDTIIGLTYDSCCWSIQVLGQRRIQNNATESVYDNAILIQLVFKGLGSVSGSQARNTLETSIYGYRDFIQ